MDTLTLKSRTFWESDTSYVLLNPKIDVKERARITHHLQPLLKGHIWLTTSGTTGRHKYVALSKEALLNSAEAVNTHLQLRKEHWVNPLPVFHVGGLSIYARAYLSQSSVTPLDKWEPKLFANMPGTIASLVPTQLYDLVKLKLISSIKVLIGGDALSEELSKQAISLGWTLLPTYGMSECASQVMTNGKILSHLTIKIDPFNELWVKGSSLLTAYAIEDKGVFTLMDPKIDGWYPTGDLAKWRGSSIKIIGRKNECFKVSGEWVSLSYLRKVLDQVIGKPHPYILKKETHPRLGHVVACDPPLPKEIAERYHALVLPYERIIRN